jgi:hypothetical protein
MANGSRTIHLAEICADSAGFSRFAQGVRIPRQSGQGFRFDVGHRSDLIAATIPN